MKILPNFDSKHFCISHWKDISLFYHDNKNIKIQICCKSDSLTINKNLPLKDQPLLQQFRKEVIEEKTDGIYGKICKYCLEKEKYNINSRRTNLNKIREKEIQEFKKEIENNNFENLNKFSLISLSTTRLCNQACIMCNTSNSTFWEKYSNFFKDRKYDIIEKELDFDFIQREINLNDKLKHIYLSGGEFLLSKNFKKVMEIIPDDFNIKVELVTALNLNSKKMLENLEYFLQRKNNLIIKISLHGTKDIYDIMSYPQKWNQFERNHQFLIDRTKYLKNFDIRYSMVVSCINIFDINDIDIFTKDKKIICLTVDSPKYLSPFLLKNKEFYLYYFYDQQIKNKDKFINYNFIEKLLDIHKKTNFTNDGDLQKIEKWRNIFKNFIKNWCEKTNTKDQYYNYIKYKKMKNLNLFSF